MDGLYLYCTVLKMSLWQKHYTMYDTLNSTLGDFSIILLFNFNGIQTENDSSWQKISFHFLKNVWKCSVFEHMHLKLAKSANMTCTILFSSTLVWGIRKHRIFYWFQVHWNVLKIKFRQKLCEFYVDFALFTMFFIYKFLSEHFFIPHTEIFMKNIFPVILVLYANFVCICSKNGSFSMDQFTKSKKLFYSKYLSISVWIPSSF